MDVDDKYILDGGPDLDIPEHKSYSRLAFDSLKLGGKKVAQVCANTEESITFEEILQKSVNFATALRNLNVKKGDIFAICSENRFEFVITGLGAMFVGATLTTINPSYVEDELRHTLNLSKPHYIACSSSTVKAIAGVLPTLPSVRSLILFDNEQLVPGLLFNNLIRTRGNVNTFELTPASDQDLMIILFSSGTTGLPKGVMVTHVNLVTYFMNYSKSIELQSTTSLERTVFPIVPWYHAYGFISMIQNLILHRKNVFIVKFEPEVFLKAIQDNKVEVLMLVPPLVVLLAKSPVVEKYDLSSVSELWCGAAPLSRELVQAVRKRIGIETVGQGYGLTETPLAVLADDSNGAKVGTLGKLLQGMKAKVTDLETGKALGPNQKGELCFKGSVIMKGYLNNKAATDAIFDGEGFMHTGDIGYYDDDGYFFIVDRLKELIKYKGFQVPPAEVEATLLQHSGVQECGVVGLPDEYAGELPLAFVVRQENSKVTEKELVDFVASKLSKQKHLRGGVRFINEIPKNPSGKVLRRKLKELLVELPKSKL